MKKTRIMGIALILMMILSIPAVPVYADEAAKAIYISTESVPKEAAERAKQEFESSGLLKSLGFSSDEIRTAALGAGFYIKDLDGSVRYETCYFPVVCGNKVTATMQIRYNDGKFSFGQFGKDTISDELNNLTTSIDDPFEIYAAENGFYCISENNTVHFYEGYPYSEASAKKELEEAKKAFSENKPSDQTIVCYGDFKTGLVNSGEKIYYVNDDGTLAYGWQNIGGKYYYFDKNGEAVTKNSLIGKTRCDFGSDGVFKGKFTGWTKAGDKKFYYADGIKQTGWYYNKENWYYFDEKTGAMATGTIEIDGIKQTFSSEGIWEGKQEIDFYTAIYNAEKKLSPDDYGGAYYDNEKLIILSVNDENVRKVINPLKKYYSQIVLKPCKFSSKELQAVRDHLADNMKKYNLSSVGTYVMENCVGITTEKIDPELQKYLDSLDDSTIVGIEIGKITIVADDSSLK